MKIDAAIPYRVGEKKQLLLRAQVIMSSHVEEHFKYKGQPVIAPK